MYKVVSTINRHKQQPETIELACVNPTEACRFMRKMVSQHRTTRKELGPSAGTQSIKVYYCGRTISKGELEKRARVAA